MKHPEVWLCFAAHGDSEWERLVDAARAACIIDTAERAVRGGWGRAVVFTPSPEVFAGSGKVEIARTEPAARIGDIIGSAALERDAGPVLYAGSGMPAMTEDDWRNLRETAADGPVANSMFSSDFAAVPEAGMLRIAGGAAVDNGFARRLRDDFGADVRIIERSARSLLDIDTPADLAVLDFAARAGGLPVGERVRSVLRDSAAALEPVCSRLAAALEVLTEKERQFLAIGRVSSAVWAVLDRDTASRIRVIAEERGLRERAAAGGRARSLLGLHAEAVGPAALAEALGEVADGVAFDTRPTLAHLGWAASRADRFASDAGDAEAIVHGELREFTAAASCSRTPIALGGHSLVSGGLLAGIDAAWGRKEAAEGGVVG